MVRLMGVLLVFLLGCSHGQKQEEKALQESNIVVTQQLQAHRYGNIYFSGQPEMNDLATLKEQGFTHVINLRESKEYNEAEERDKVKATGMHYTHLTLGKQESLDLNKMKSITQAVQQHRKEGKTLIHCSSGNRAAYWAGAHFYLDHDYDEQGSLEMAKKLGMNKPKMEKKLSTFIEKHKDCKKNQTC